MAHDGDRSRDVSITGLLSCFIARDAVSGKYTITTTTTTAIIAIIATIVRTTSAAATENCN